MPEMIDYMFPVDIVDEETRPDDIFDSHEIEDMMNLQYP